MFEFDMIQCGMIVLFLMAIGEVISHKLKMIIPSLLASAILFLILVWCNIIPSSVIEDSGFLSFTSVAMMLNIVGMGISTNPKELISNWRVVLLAAATYATQTISLLLIMSLLFGRNMAIGGLPGGAAVGLIVQEHARALDLDNVVVLSVLVLSVQLLVACPLVSLMLRKEVTRYQKEGLLTQAVAEHAADTAASVKHKANSPYLSLFRLYLVAWVASRLELYTGLSKYIFCLLLGAILAYVGFFPKDEMERSKSQGMILVMMMSMMFYGFADATPQMFKDLMIPFVCVLGIDVASIFLFSRVFGKLLKFSKPMSFAISLNIMVGYPMNLMLTQDNIDYLIPDPEERKVLNQQLGTQMVIGGFTSVTILSTIMAGLLVNLLH